MFEDLHTLTGVALGRAAMREIYGRDCDGPTAQPHQKWLGFDMGWAARLASALVATFNRRAVEFGLPQVLGTALGDHGHGSRAGTLVLSFRGGFRVRVPLADIGNAGAVTALVLHRMMRVAHMERTRKYQHYYAPTDYQPYDWDAVGQVASEQART